MSAPAPHPVVAVEHLEKHYDTAAGPVPVLHDVNLAIAAGEFVAVMGPSGSGKSTFMNILGGLDHPTGGRYLLDGHDVSRLAGDALAGVRNRFIGFVFQGFNLLPRASVLENVALPMVYAGVPRRERLRRAGELLERVGLGNRGHHRPSQISGGQQQRVAIARALANRPQLLLADEPTGNLDTATSHEVMELFARLNHEDRTTIVLVTHEADVARFATRRIAFLDGRVVEDAPVTDRVWSPAVAAIQSDAGRPP
jgi:putative ABC transport system ATP-binding protein